MPARLHARIQEAEHRLYPQALAAFLAPPPRPPSPPEAETAARQGPRTRRLERARQLLPPLSAGGVWQAEARGRSLVPSGTERPPKDMTDERKADKLGEECGLFALAGAEGAGRFAILGLHALQHRGQEAAGLAVRTERGLEALRGAGDGRAGLRLPPAEAGARRAAGTARGHRRPRDTCATPPPGGAELASIQPLLFETRYGPLGVGPQRQPDQRRPPAARTPRRGRAVPFLGRHRGGAPGSSLPSQAPSLEEAFAEAAGRAAGGLVAHRLDARQARRPARPAGGCARLSSGGSARPLCSPPRPAPSTSSAPSSSATSHRVSSMSPGPQARLSLNTAAKAASAAARARALLCFRVHLLHAPDSRFMGREVSAVREKTGEALFAESHRPSDAVVPGSGLRRPCRRRLRPGPRACPTPKGILRSHYTGRTFIEPSDPIRHLGVKLKLSVNAASVAGKRLVLVDDSIVRGTTMPKIVEMLRRAGAAEIHVRIASPPFRHPCHFGIDTRSTARGIRTRGQPGELGRAGGHDRGRQPRLSLAGRPCFPPSARRGTLSAPSAMPA